MKKKLISVFCALLSVVTLGCTACEGWGMQSENSEESYVSESTKDSEESSVSIDKEDDPNENSSDENEKDSGEENEGEDGSLDDSNDGTETEELMIVSPAGEVFPYAESPKKYLQAGAGVNVGNYCSMNGHYGTLTNPQVAIPIEWKGLENAVSYKAEYATKADYSDAITVETNETEIGVYNLYKGTEYFVRVTAYGGEGETLDVVESTFTTTDLGPRVMNVDGINNVRDLGGYVTGEEQRTVQGLLYRGGTLTPADVYTSNITEEGIAYMSEEMGIKTEIDFRASSESGLTESLIPGATLVSIPLAGYANDLQTNRYKQLFSMLARKENYPIYIHCTGGADRTGSASFLINALLGVAEEQLIQDYEFTSFSVFGQRNTQTGDYAPYFKLFRQQLALYDGSSLREKVENYLLSLGVTADEIYNIRAIMHGQPTKTALSTQTNFTKHVDESLTLTFEGEGTPQAVYVDGKEVDFTHTNGTITVSAAAMPELTEGRIEGKVLFNDGAEAGFTFTYDIGNPVVELDEYMAFDGDGKVTLGSGVTQVTGNKAVGYGTTVCVRMQSNVIDTNGGVTVMIGSYGFHLRGGEFRPYQMSEGVAPTETARSLGMAADNKIFNNGTVLLYLTIEIVADRPVMTILLVSGTEKTKYSYTYTSRIDGEIATDDATMTFAIRTDACSALTVYTKDAWKNKAETL